MTSVGIGVFGLLSFIVTVVIPIVVLIFVFLWLHQIKKSNETQVDQNHQIIQLLEELKNK